MNGNNICPCCGSPVKIGVGHHCQSSDLNEHYKQIADSHGGCTDAAVEARERDKEWEKMGFGGANIEPGSLISKD